MYAVVRLAPAREIAAASCMSPAIASILVPGWEPEPNRPGARVSKAEVVMVSFSEWLSDLKDLHEKARAGQLDPEGLSTYRSSRDELMRSLLVAQQITREYGHTARQSMRMAWALQVDLEPSKDCIRVVTLDISVGGFSALLGSRPPADRDIEFSMRLPGGKPLQGRARVVAAIAKPGNYRVSFSFVTIGADDAERLNSFLFDRVLALLVGPSGDARAVNAA
jgi:hypothetical protein